MENLYWVPSNGKEIKFWKDTILGKPPPRLPRLQNWMEARALSTLWSISEWDVNYPNRWLSWVLPDCPEELENDKSKMITHLAGIAPISKISKDRRGWGDRNGNYSTAEGYNVFAATYNVPANPRIWNHNWNNKTFPKIDVFTWTLIHQRLLTGENMERRGIAGPFRCPLCAANPESISHLFFNCSYSISIWKEVIIKEEDGFSWNGNNQEFFIHWDRMYKGELGGKNGVRAC